MLEVRNIEVVFNDLIIVLRGISISVPQSGVVTVLGANGAGKTTLLNSISSLLKSKEGEVKDGEILFNESRIDNLRPEMIVKLGISQVPEGRDVFPEMTVGENVRIGGYVIRKDRKRLEKNIEQVLGYFPALRTRISTKAGFLSGGEQQMLAVARGLMSSPHLIMLDEPSMGLAPLLVQELFKILKNIQAQEKIAILLIEQNARMALDFASYGYVMENGRIVMDAPASKLREDEDIQEFYMGITGKSELKSYKEIKHYKRRKRWLS